MERFTLVLAKIETCKTGINKRTSIKVPLTQVYYLQLQRLSNYEKLGVITEFRNILPTVN